MKRALITGITGQDGSYLADFLMEKGYEVHGIIRRSSSFNTGRIIHAFSEVQDPDKKMILHYGDLTDASSLEKVVSQVKPHEVYNLGCQSHVRVSFDQPIYTVDTVAMGAMKVLEAILNSGMKDDIRFYQASSSEMYGKVHAVPQSEETPFHPRSPYACGKVFAFYQTLNYREAYGMHASNGILFNHESPRRGETFVTRKITRGLAKIVAGKQDKLFMGNLDARRDWGYAKDYVEAMWLMLQQDKADDYVIATGETHSVKEFLQEAFSLVDLNWEKYVEIDERYFRPSEVDLLLGDATKAKEKMGWTPRTSFQELVKIMVKADLDDEGVGDRLQ